MPSTANARAIATRLLGALLLGRLHFAMIGPLQATTRRMISHRLAAARSAVNPSTLAHGRRRPSGFGGRVPRPGAPARLQQRHVGRVHQQSVDAIAHDLRRAALGRRRHRHAGSQRLEQHQPPGLALGRVGEDVQPPDRLPPIGHVARHLHRVLQAQPCGLFLQLAGIAAIGVHSGASDDPSRAPGIDSRTPAAPSRPAPHASSEPAARPRPSPPRRRPRTVLPRRCGQRRRLDTRMHHVHRGRVCRRCCSAIQSAEQITPSAGTRAATRWRRGFRSRCSCCHQTAGTRSSRAAGARVQVRLVHVCKHGVRSLARIASRSRATRRGARQTSRRVPTESRRPRRRVRALGGRPRRPRGTRTRSPHRPGHAGSATAGHESSLPARRCGKPEGTRTRCGRVRGMSPRPLRVLLGMSFG